MGRENTKIVKHLQERVIKKRVYPTKDELNSIDTNIHPQEFRNSVLKKDFFGSWTISLFNENHDLDANPIAHNPKLKQILKAYYENGKKIIIVQPLTFLLFGVLFINFYTTRLSNNR